ncbi:hypothetical protein FIV42_15825 [Persicimonas caeni]|uniref:Uncharacterized protein n=1 Tax=Persicimonas caeni TaxID=2292766 RepID=A0A4Y6PV23_PERCE|nr:hypothetical protein [Persicimonas caeni]QDG52158.1 hypothetical protein FIV42_15825 [Persicimonas caeni]QED33380.1 hypothetical protein FRD00_15820 [Persicimonas caeni]
MRFYLMLVLFAAALVATGCDLNRHTGEHGQIVFEYYSLEDHTNFNKPIIEGGRVELFLYEVGDEAPLDVIAATSLAPDTAVVDGHVANLVVVHGLAPGRARFEVRAVDEDGEVHVDTLAMRVDRARTIRMYGDDASVFNGASDSSDTHIAMAKLAAETHLMDEEDWEDDEDDEDEDDAVQRLTFETGDRVEIPWTRYSATGEPLIGYGAYPIAIDPPNAAKLHDRLTDDDAFTLFMPEEPQTFEVVPAAGYEGDRLVIEVVEEDIVEETAEHIDRLGTKLAQRLGMRAPRELRLDNQSPHERSTSTLAPLIEPAADAHLNGLLHLLALWLITGLLGALAVWRKFARADAGFRQ